MNEVLPYNVIDSILSSRDAALAQMSDAINMIRKGHEAATGALTTSYSAHGGSVCTSVDYSKTPEYERIFARFDADRSLAAFRQQLDARVWIHLMTASGIYDLMDKEARDSFRKQLKKEVPEVTRDNLEATAQGLRADARTIFLRSIANAFAGLDRRFKSHDAFKIGSRVILTRVFDESGYWNYYSNMRDVFADLKRVFAVLDGKKPDPGALARKISEGRDSYGPQQSLTETDYFRIRTFKNGNAHVWFVRDDLVEKANLLLAEYFGEVLPDAVGPEVSPKDFRSDCRDLAKDLSFYPTPEKVIKDHLLSRLYGTGLRVLEPSAGTGHIARQLLSRGHSVDAVEVDPARYRELCAIASDRLRVSNENFLTTTPVARYDAVVMNPPFYGTHYMDHVEHAYKYLRERGTLISVVPITAELHDTKKHRSFRKWVKSNRGKFYDLPEGSFASSGTRINTMVLEMGK